MHNITGYSAGGRRPLTYNLMPGQFRNTRVNVFSNQTIINNNIGGFGGCYDYGDCGCGCDSGMPKWMGWMMGGGMLLNGLGSILSCFWGGGGGGGTKADAPDLASLKADANAYAKDLNVKIQVLSDGQFLCNGVKYKSLDDLAADVKGDDGAGDVGTTKTIAGDNDFTDIQEEATKFNEKYGANAKLKAIGTKDTNGEYKQYWLTYKVDGKSTTVLVRTVMEAIGKIEEAGVKPAETKPNDAPTTSAQPNIDTQREAFAELFDAAYIKDNFQTEGEHAGKLKVGSQYFDNVNKAHKEFVTTRTQSKNNTVVSQATIDELKNGALKPGTTIDIIDDSSVGDFMNKTIGKWESGDKVKIGSKTYSVEIKGNGKYVYLTDTSSTNKGNTQVYLLEQTSGGKYQAVQREHLAFVNKDGGWNKGSSS